MRYDADLLPVLLESDLFKSGWNGALSPYPDISPTQQAMCSLRRSFFKKFQDEISGEANTRALALFEKINEECKGWKWDPDILTTAETVALGEAKDYINCFFYDDSRLGFSPRLDHNSIARGFGVGNGSNIGVKTTDFFSKVGTSTLATTSLDLYKFYVQAIDHHHTWSDLESIRLANRGVEIVQASRLSFVPKTAEISRTICTEPILNMLFQKGIASVLEEGLRQISGIDLGTQPDKNRELCRLGSVTGGFGTIDLSSASDSMSIGLVREFFPRQVNYWLGLARTPATVLPDGRRMELHMVSSMGNAFTFPLQTLFFCSLIYAAYKTLGIPFRKSNKRSLGNFAVFGDDIIVTNKAYGFVCRLLSICGFKVNIDKSFNQGPFRESCGRDYFHGLDVRGVYIQSLKTSSDVYSAINRLNIWSIKHNVPLPLTISSLLKRVRFLPVPFDEDETAGVKVPEHLLRRKTRCIHTGGIKYRCMVPVNPTIKLDDISMRRKLKGYFRNDSALLLSAVAGTLRGGVLVPRQHDKPRFRIQVKYSSSWNYMPPTTRYSSGSETYGSMSSR